MVDQPSAVVSVYADRVYFRVNVGLPRLLRFLMENDLSEGTSIIVQGRLRVDTYTNSRGVRATSLAVIAQRMRLDSRVSLTVTGSGIESSNMDVSATEVINGLRAANLLQDAQQMTQLTPNQHILLAAIEQSQLVVNSGAIATDLLSRLQPFIDTIIRRDPALRAEQIVSLLPDGVTLSQARTFLDEITPPAPSADSSRASSRIQYRRPIDVNSDSD
ncbi:hypothetical protein BDB00DRAFT_878199 [Zychaea mexicana]|uniref:uncharacterized protein n=1 Tax=Zychaea mexicana TaxID=64656 RepID=UPI0022FE652D|nr:uncharacterized protein BDB00DRAFT_878199 [Zychaea mexicana]KAI9484993.1 hypothetical protein BDB00DRAFT_878199 [Zychaea mexicana]